MCQYAGGAAPSQPGPGPVSPKNPLTGHTPLAPPPIPPSVISPASPLFRNQAGGTCSPVARSPSRAAHQLAHHQNVTRGVGKGGAV